MAPLQQPKNGFAQRADLEGSQTARQIKKRNRAGLTNGDGKIWRLHGSYPICRGNHSTCAKADLCRKISGQQKIDVDRAVVTAAEGSTLRSYWRMTTRRPRRHLSTIPTRTISSSAYRQSKTWSVVA